MQKKKQKKYEGERGRRSASLLFFEFVICCRKFRGRLDIFVHRERERKRVPLDGSQEIIEDEKMTKGGRERRENKKRERERREKKEREEKKKERKREEK